MKPALSSRAAGAPLATAALLAAALLAGCSHPGAPPPSSGSVALPRPTGGSPDQPPSAALIPGSAYAGERALCIDRELERLGLNEYGDPPGTRYANGSPIRSEDGTPLRNQVTGLAMSRFDYVVRRRPDIGATCSRNPLEPQR